MKDAELANVICHEKVETNVMEMKRSSLNVKSTLFSPCSIASQHNHRPTNARRHLHIESSVQTSSIPGEDNHGESLADYPHPLREATGLASSHR